MEDYEAGKKLTRKEQAIQTRRKLFDKAIETFSHTDMDDVRIKDLCDSSNVSVGTFYNYFSTKEDLMLEAYRFFDEEVVSRARANTYASNLEALYCILEYQCGHYEGLFDIENDPLAAAIARHYSEAELLLWKQVLRILLRNGGDNVMGYERPMNSYVRELINKALADGELVSDESPEIIADAVLRISRGTIFDWSVRNAPYCLYKQAVSDVKHYLKVFKPDYKN